MKAEVLRFHIYPLALTFGTSISGIFEDSLKFFFIAPSEGITNLTQQICVLRVKPYIMRLMIRVMCHTVPAIM